MAIESSNVYNPLMFSYPCWSSSGGPNIAGSAQCRRPIASDEFKAAGVPATRWIARLCLDRGFRFGRPDQDPYTPTPRSTHTPCGRRRDHLRSLLIGTLGVGTAEVNLLAVHGPYRRAVDLDLPLTPPLPRP